MQISKKKRTRFSSAQKGCLKERPPRASSPQAGGRGRARTARTAALPPARRGARVPPEAARPSSRKIDPAGPDRADTGRGPAASLALRGVLLHPGGPAQGPHAQASVAAITCGEPGCRDSWAWALPRLERWSLREARPRRKPVTPRGVPFHELSGPRLQPTAACSPAAPAPPHLCPEEMLLPHRAELVWGAEAQGPPGEVPTLCWGSGRSQKPGRDKI